jgi:uncharacterized membrane protein YfcA
VFVARAFAVGDAVKYALGVALLLAVAGLVAKTWLGGKGGSSSAHDIVVRPIPTVLIGTIGGLVVGISSVGSGSLIIVALLALYPALKANQLVGTDLVQAVPLVASAALGHLLFGDFQLQLTVSLLIGSIPGVYLGARISSRAPGGLIRAVLGIVLLASALKLLDVDTMLTLWAIAGATLVTVVGWRWRVRAERRTGDRGEPVLAGQGRGTRVERK